MTSNNENMDDILKYFDDIYSEVAKKLTKEEKDAIRYVENTNYSIPRSHAPHYISQHHAEHIRNYDNEISDMLKLLKMSDMDFKDMYFQKKTIFDFNTSCDNELLDDIDNWQMIQEVKLSC
jgi:hypothetical protein